MDNNNTKDPRATIDKERDRCERMRLKHATRVRDLKHKQDYVTWGGYMMAVFGIGGFLGLVRAAGLRYYPMSAGFQNLPEINWSFLLTVGPIVGSAYAYFSWKGWPKKIKAHRDAGCAYQEARKEGHELLAKYRAEPTAEEAARFVGVVAKLDTEYAELNRKVAKQDLY